MVEPWPFDQPRNCAVFVTREVLEGREPIVRVTHDSDDHGWQFIGSSDGTSENARIIALSEAVNLDPSVLSLADLPVDWRAWRDSPDEPWVRGAGTDVTQTK
ncbi:MAG: hypothetical protein QOG67_2552 [Verrucomicrobiota bacterium]|jgi:hypothetical protein